MRKANLQAYLEDVTKEELQEWENSSSEKLSKKMNEYRKTSAMISAVRENIRKRMDIVSAMIARKNGIICDTPSIDHDEELRAFGLSDNIVKWIGRKYLGISSLERLLEFSKESLTENLRRHCAFYAAKGEEYLTDEQIEELINTLVEKLQQKGKSLKQDNGHASVAAKK